MDPNEYLCTLCEGFQDELPAAITRLAARKHRPPMTPI
jgi:hypothetical protein